MPQDNLIIYLIGIGLAIAIAFGIYRWSKMKHKGTEYPHVGVGKPRSDTPPHVSPRSTPVTHPRKENA